MVKVRCVDDVVENAVRRFARKQKLVDAVYKGHLPEHQAPVYFFVTRYKRYDETLTDAITDLDLKIYRKTKAEFNLIRWPINPENAKDSEFLDECLYEK